MIDVAAAVIIENGKVLIARRRPGISQAGQWEFPGGKLKPGETPEQCLAREIREELGIAIAVGEFLGESIHAYPQKTIRLIAYRARLLGGNLKASDHDETAWVGVAELERYPFSPADRPFVELLQRHLPPLPL
jgi:8-oxo-dGTP diphosphatase